MKKRTVITTETREFWIVQQPHESSQEDGYELVRTPRDAEEDKQSLVVPSEQPQPDETPLENE